MAASGTVGGAIHAAQAGHFPLGTVLEWADVAHPGMPVERVKPAAREIGGRGLDFGLERRVILRARLRSVKDGGSDLRIRLADDRPNRWQKQTRTAGPAFVGPGEVRAEALLAQADCLGLSVGGARLSVSSPNRIRTSRSARSGEVLELMQIARRRVMDRTGFDLKSALCFVDERGRTVEP